MNEEISGIILSFNPERGFGIIIASNGDRFFYHQNQIFKGPACPKMNDQVVFIAGKPSASPHRLPHAREIKIISSALGDVQGTQEGGK